MLQPGRDYCPQPAGLGQARLGMVPTDYGIWALNHAGEEMQKRSEKRQQETDMAAEEGTPSLGAAAGLSELLGCH